MDSCDQLAIDKSERDSEETQVKGSGALMIVRTSSCPSFETTRTREEEENKRQTINVKIPPPDLPANSLFPPSPLSSYSLISRRPLLYVSCLIPENRQQLLMFDVDDRRLTINNR